MTGGKCITNASVRNLFTQLFNQASVFNPL